MCEDYYIFIKSLFSLIITIAKSKRYLIIAKRMVKHFWIYVNNDHFCLQNHMPISSKKVKENWNIHQQFIWNMPSKSPNHMQKSANQSATQVNWMISVKPNMKNVLSEIYTFTLTGPSCLRYTQKNSTRYTLMPIVSCERVIWHLN